VFNEPSHSTGDLVYTLNEGEEVALQESRKGWHRIINIDGQDGWVLKDEVRELY
jgi:hypothetical protein